MIKEWAGCAIFNDREEILLLRRRTDDGRTQWEIPGGKREWGEPRTQTALREVCEETGVIIMIGRTLLEGEFNHNDRLYDCQIFAGRIAAGEPEIREPHIHEALGFFPLTALPELPLSAGAQVLSAAFQSGEFQVRQAPRDVSQQKLAVAS
jgi:ADP-ribose pyrophosphatase YjhB (NUDIX family)